MADNRNDTENQGVPQPDPALQRLNRLVGTWSLKGRPLGSDKDTIIGTTTFKWLPGGFFLQQDMEMDYDGKPIKSHELIVYDPKTKAFSSYVYSNMAPDPGPTDGISKAIPGLSQLNMARWTQSSLADFRPTAAAFQAAGDQTQGLMKRLTQPMILADHASSNMLKA